MKLPTRLAASLAAAYTGLAVLANEIEGLPHWAHQLIVAAGVLLAAFTIHPGESGVIAGGIPPVAGATAKPEPPAPAPASSGGEPL